MVAVMTSRHLELSLHPGSTIPCNLSWRIEDGYLRVTSWGDQGEFFTLGIWGPGDLVIPALMAFDPLQLSALSTIRLVEATPNPEQREAFLVSQSQQISTLLKLSDPPIRAPLTRSLTRQRPLANELLPWAGQTIKPPYQQDCQSCGTAIPNPLQSSLKFANST
jgi:hypothetical protein